MNIYSSLWCRRPACTPAVAKLKAKPEEWTGWKFEIQNEWVVVSE